MDLLDRDAPQTETYLQITSGGVGSLNARTVYSEAAIKAAMPGYATGTVLIGEETETRDAIALFRSDTGSKVQVLQVVGKPGGDVTEIHGVTHAVIGPGGERPGMSLAQAGVDPTSCRAGTKLWLGMAICASRAAPNVKLTFSFTGDAATSDKLPPRDVLELGELQRIIWTPQG
jgi:Protein of unknown function (DUF1131)